MIPVLIGAGVSALMPLLSEAMRDKPDPEAAKLLIESKRAEMVDKAVGAGLDRQKAEAQVDAEIQKGFAEAERQGQFNFPGGEMIASAILGGAGGWALGKAASKFAPNLTQKVSDKLGMGAGKKASAEAAASKVADTDDVAQATVGAASPIPSAAPGRMPVVGSAPTPSMAAPGPTGMPFPSVTSKRDLEMEFAGASPARAAQQPGQAMSEISTPFPRMERRGGQTLEDEFGFTSSKPYSEMDLRGEFGSDAIPLDRAGSIRRLMQRQGD